MAIIQFESTADPSANRRALAELIGGINGHVDLIVLPEATARRFGGPGEALAPDSESLEGPFVETLQRLAGQTSSVIMAGMFERSEVSERPYNTTVVVDRDGLLGCYRKVHLYDALGFVESSGVTPGAIDADNLLVFSVGGMRVGVMTCFDLRFPEMARLLIDQGAQAIALGAAWVPGPMKISQFTTLLGARAIESAAYVLAASQPAPGYCGSSQIIDPEGRRLAAAGEGSTAVLRSEISADEVARVRRHMPVLEQRRMRVIADQ